MAELKKICPWFQIFPVPHSRIMVAFWIMRHATPWKLNLDILKSEADLQHQGNWDSLPKFTLRFKVIYTIELESLFLQ